MAFTDVKLKGLMSVLPKVIFFLGFPFLPFVKKFTIAVYCFQLWIYGNTRRPGRSFKSLSFWRHEGLSTTCWWENARSTLVFITERPGDWVPSIHAWSSFRAPWESWEDCWSQAGWVFLRSIQICLILDCLYQ